MKVKCPYCGRVYNDAVFLTICPHDVTVGGQKYCRYHDLFDCQFAHPTFVEIAGKGGT
jgi:hypothetical protein